MFPITLPSSLIRSYTSGFCFSILFLICQKLFELIPPALMSSLSLLSVLSLSSLSISSLNLVWQVRYAPLAFLLSLLVPLRHDALKVFRSVFLSFLSVRIVSLVVFNFLLISKDVLPMCKFNAEIIALVAYYIPYIFCLFPDFAHFCVVFLPFFCVAFLPNVDDFWFVGSFHLNSHGDCSMVSWLFTPYVEGVIFISFRFNDSIM